MSRAALWGWLVFNLGAAVYDAATKHWWFLIVSLGLATWCIAKLRGMDE